MFRAWMGEPNFPSLNFLMEEEIPIQLNCHPKTNQRLPYMQANSVEAVQDEYTTTDGMILTFVHVGLCHGLRLGQPLDELCY